MSHAYTPWDTVLQSSVFQDFKVHKQARSMCRHLGASMAVHRSKENAEMSRKDNMACLVSSQAAVTSEIREQHDIPQCGRFTAYTDGNVHVTFHDRALLYMQSSQEHCEVITPDGHRFTVSTATPLGVEQYVAQAMEFADWAFSSSSERAAVLHQAARIHQEIGKCQRAAALCDWAQGQLVSVPQRPDETFDLSQADSCTKMAVLDKTCTTLFSSPTQEHTTSVEREQMIQALLAKSNHLLNTLSS